MLKSKLRYIEARKARIKAEINFRLNGAPIQLSCVYKRPEQRNQYLRGWHSVTQVDVEAVLMRMQGNQRLIYQHNKQQLANQTRGATFVEKSRRTGVTLANHIRGATCG